LSEVILGLSRRPTSPPGRSIAESAARRRRHGTRGAHEFDSLGEEFEKKENQLFGEDGFEKVVDRVAGIEKRLGIYDLAQFTPKG